MRQALVLMFVSVSALPLLACEVRVQRDEERRADNVAITTPLGALNVRSDAQPTDVGLPVFPGARAVTEWDDDRDQATVDIDSPFGGLRVATLKFETDATPDAVVEFYRQQMANYGAVTVCRGNLDFDDADPGEAPKCREGRERRDRRRVHVGVGARDEFHLASVKTRGDVTEFSLVYIRTERS